MNGFKDLIVWQKGYELSLLVYKITNNYPMRSCSISVPANISEGYERRSKKEYLYFLNVAKGSLGELETYLLLSRDLNFINENEWRELEDLREITLRLLRGLMRSVRDKLNL